MSSTDYDTIAYPSRAVSVTHPYSLGAMAILYRMHPAPPEHCRVLEIGCGDGANLLPMAAALPQSRFVGFDLAGAAVAKGSGLARKLSLRNIELKQLDIMDAGRELGEFDYVIAHGVYTWVAPAIQSRLLELCDEVLARDGVAYISYNVLPGGYIREMVRSVMLLHAGSEADPYTRVSEGRKVLSLIAEDRKKPDPWLGVLKQELADVLACTPEEIFHDEFAANYNQVYFKDFVANARESGLDYLAEAELADMTPFGFGEGATEMLERLASGDRVIYEQTLDFFRFRKFRRTLLCRSGVQRRTTPDATALRDLYLSSRAQPVEGTQRWKGPENAVIEIVDPAVSRLMKRLVEAWPQALRGEDLFANAPGTEQAVLDLCTIKFVQASSWAPPAARASVNKPCFSPFVRSQATSGKVTNLYHQAIDIQGDLALSLLELADGTRDRESLIAQLALMHPGHSYAEIAGGFDQQLRELARLALLSAC